MKEKMAASKRQRLLLGSIRISGKMNPVPQLQTPQTPPSPTDTTATSMNVVGDQPIPALSAVSGLGPQRLPQCKGFLLFGKLHPLTPPTDTTSAFSSLVADEPILASSAVPGKQDTDKPPGPKAPVRLRRIGTTLCKKKGLKLWESYLYIPGVHIPDLSKKGFRIFLGYYLTTQEAQDVHDRAALKLSETEGVVARLNFHESRHAEFMEKYKDWNFRDFGWQFRRYSDRFTTGRSFMKGVAVIESAKRNLFEAKIVYTYLHGVPGQVYYLGKFESEEEAGRAYDRALLFLHHKETEVQKLHVITNSRPSWYSESEILRARKVNNIRSPGSLE